METVALSVFPGRGDASCEDDGEERTVNAECADPNDTSERADCGRASSMGGS